MECGEGDGFGLQGEFVAVAVRFESEGEVAGGNRCAVWAGDYELTRKRAVTEAAASAVAIVLHVNTVDAAGAAGGRILDVHGAVDDLNRVCEGGVGVLVVLQAASRSS